MEREPKSDDVSVGNDDVDQISNRAVWGIQSRTDQVEESKEVRRDKNRKTKKFNRVPRLTALTHMPHGNVVKHLTRIGGSPFNDKDIVRHEVEDFLSSGTAKECLAKLILLYNIQKSNLGPIDEQSSSREES